MKTKFRLFKPFVWIDLLPYSISALMLVGILYLAWVFINHYKLL